MHSSSRSRRIGLLAVFLGLFLMQLDVSIVNIALNAIRADLGVPGGRLPWVVDGYTLPIAALMLTIGTVGDRMGHRRLYVGGLALFLIGTLGCAISATFGMLVAARVVQGLGGAAIAPASLALLMPMFPAGPARQRAVGLWASVGGLGFVVGPILGGTLTNSFGWQAAFVVTAIASAIAVLASFWLKEEHTPDARPVDVAGILFGAVTLAALVTWLIEGPSAGWISYRALLAAAAAALGVVGFAFVERRAPAPMLPLRLFRSGAYISVNFATVVVTFGGLGVLFVFGLFLQEQMHLSPAEAGLWMLPFSFAFVVSSAWAEVVVRWIGQRATVATGLFAQAGGLIALLLLGQHPSYLELLPILLVLGTCVGLEMAPLVAMGVSALPARDRGIASGVVNTSRQVGTALGTALLGSIYGVGGWEAYRSALVVAIVVYFAGGVVIRFAGAMPLPAPDYEPVAAGGDD